MGTPRVWQGASRRLIVSFVLVLLVPAAAVVWLGARLIEQDRAIASDQLRERRESAADLFIAGLAQAIAFTERQLGEQPANLPIRPDDDAVLVRLDAGATEVHPVGRLLYVPAVPPPSTEPDEAFLAGEVLEFREQDNQGAAGVYRQLTASPSPAVRAGALMRLARTSRKLGRTDEALRAYTDLARLHDVRVAGLPADLVARRARCVVLQEIGRTAELSREAQTLQTDLLAARWPIDRGTFVAYSEQVNRWVGTDPVVDPERDALSAAAEWIGRQRTDLARSEFPATGRRSLRFEGISMSLLWQSVGEGLIVLVAGPRFQQREWFDAHQRAVEARGLRVALADLDGQPVAGTLPAQDDETAERRASAATGLPWTVLVASRDAAVDLDEIASRQRLLFAGLAVLVGLVITGGYFIVRAVSREFAVAQLQSDFVSAVSHEFRTPLTSLAQFTDLLNDDPDLPAAKRRTFYQAQARATERLRRLVESLLDFGRMEAGARPYRLERLAIGPLVATIVQDFQRDATPEGFIIEASIDAEGVEADVDPDAFTRALWNLLDNAVKYSGSSRIVSVALDVRDGSIAVRVRDDGLGIPSHEHEQIFRKFVRGASSRTNGIKGTGIGLAMVRHIVEAHGGSVAVESEPGEGSTFTITLATVLDSSFHAPAQQPSNRPADVNLKSAL
jgi:signal transduction histidine kinase